MSKFFSKLGTPTSLLYIFVVLTQLASGIYLASEREPPPAFSLLYALGFLWIIGWWLLRDSRERSVGWVYDMGLFLYIAWPFIMLYYLLKTRGAQGLWVILSFLGVYVGALLAGMMLYDLFIR
jgi:hypothetical protein